MARGEPFVEDIRIRQPGQQPAIARELLTDLGVRDAPVEEQRRAVADWLSENEPHRLLRDTLRDKGLLPGGD